MGICCAGISRKPFDDKKENFSREKLFKNYTNHGDTNTEMKAKMDHYTGENYNTASEFQFEGEIRSYFHNLQEIKAENYYFTRKAIYKKTNEKVILKSVNKRNCPALELQAYKKIFISEKKTLEALHKLGKKFFISCYGIFETEEEITLFHSIGDYSIEELIRERSLNAEHLPYKKKDLLIFLKCLTEILSVLKHNEIFHNFITPENIVANLKTQSYQLIDFSKSQMLNDDSFIKKIKERKGPNRPSARNFDAESIMNHDDGPYKFDLISLGECLKKMMASSKIHDSRFNELVRHITEYNLLSPCQLEDIAAYLKENHLVVGSKMISDKEIQIIRKLDFKNCKWEICSYTYQRWKDRPNCFEKGVVCIYYLETKLEQAADDMERGALINEIMEEFNYVKQAYKLETAQDYDKDVLSLLETKEIYINSLKKDNISLSISLTNELLERIRPVNVIEMQRLHEIIFEFKPPCQKPHECEQILNFLIENSTDPTIIDGNYKEKIKMLCDTIPIYKNSKENFEIPFKNIKKIFYQLEKDKKFCLRHLNRRKYDLIKFKLEEMILLKNLMGELKSDTGISVHSVITGMAEEMLTRYNSENKFFSEEVKSLFMEGKAIKREEFDSVLQKNEEIKDFFNLVKFTKEKCSLRGEVPSYIEVSVQISQILDEKSAKVENLTLSDSLALRVHKDLRIKINFLKKNYNQIELGLEAKQKALEKLLLDFIEKFAKLLSDKFDIKKAKPGGLLGSESVSVDKSILKVIIRELKVAHNVESSLGNLYPSIALKTHVDTLFQKILDENYEIFSKFFENKTKPLEGNHVLRITEEYENLRHLAVFCNDEEIHSISLVLDGNLRRMRELIIRQFQENLNKTEYILKEKDILNIESSWKELQLFQSNDILKELTINKFQQICYKIKKLSSVLEKECSEMLEKMEKVEKARISIGYKNIAEKISILKGMISWMHKYQEFEDTGEINRNLDILLKTHLDKFSSKLKKLTTRILSARLETIEENMKKIKIICIRLKEMSVECFENNLKDEAEAALKNVVSNDNQGILWVNLNNIINEYTDTSRICENKYESKLHENIEVESKLVYIEACLRDFEELRDTAEIAKLKLNDYFIKLYEHLRREIRKNCEDIKNFWEYSKADSKSDSRVNPKAIVSELNDLLKNNKTFERISNQLRSSFDLIAILKDELYEPLYSKIAIDYQFGDTYGTHDLQVRVSLQNIIVACLPLDINFITKSFQLLNEEILKKQKIFMRELFNTVKILFDNHEYVTLKKKLDMISKFKEYNKLKKQAEQFLNQQLKNESERMCLLKESAKASDRPDLSKFIDSLNKIKKADILKDYHAISIDEYLIQKEIEGILTKIIKKIVTHIEELEFTEASRLINYINNIRVDLGKISDDFNVMKENLNTSLKSLWQNIDGEINNTENVLKKKFPDFLSSFNDSSLINLYNEFLMKDYQHFRVVKSQIINHIELILGNHLKEIEKNTLKTQLKLYEKTQKTINNSKFVKDTVFYNYLQMIDDKCEEVKQALFKKNEDAIQTLSSDEGQIFYIFKQMIIENTDYDENTCNQFKKYFENKIDSLKSYIKNIYENKNNFDRRVFFENLHEFYKLDHSDLFRKIAEAQLNQIKIYLKEIILAWTQVVSNYFDPNISIEEFWHYDDYDINGESAFKLILSVPENLSEDEIRLCFPNFLSSLGDLLIKIKVTILTLEEDFLKNLKSINVKLLLPEKNLEVIKQIFKVLEKVRSRNCFLTCLQEFNKNQKEYMNMITDKMPGNELSKLVDSLSISDHLNKQLLDLVEEYCSFIQKIEFLILQPIEDEPNLSYFSELEFKLKAIEIVDVELETGNIPRKDYEDKMQRAIKSIQTKKDHVSEKLKGFLSMNNFDQDSIRNFAKYYKCYNTILERLTIEKLRHIGLTKEALEREIQSEVIKERIEIANRNNIDSFELKRIIEELRLVKKHIWKREELDHEIKRLERKQVESKQLESKQLESKQLESEQLEIKEPLFE